MKNIYTYLICCALPLSTTFAQDGPVTNAPLASSLKISGDRTNNERIEFLTEVAQAYLVEKDTEAAINVYERILQIDPAHLQSRYIIAHLYISAKQYRKAEVLLKKLTGEFPEDFKLWNNLAWLYATAEDPEMRNGEKAVKCAQEALTLAPNDHHVWSTLSEAYYVSGKYEKSYRAITHMASLAARYGTDITKESVESYNEQIRKCKRAMDTAKIMNADAEE